MSNEAEVSKRTFKVPVENLDRLHDQIGLVNRRVDRLRKRGYDVELVSISVGQSYFVKGSTGERAYADVELLSPKPPKVEGWEFVAALTHVEGIGTVLRVVPGAQVSEGELASYREANPDNCDHCHASRKRNDTFVIRDREGALRQVGRQCLQAYTGLARPEILCASAEILFSLSELLSDSEDDDFGGGGGSVRWYAPIARYLPFVACSIREDGWLSRTAAREQGHLERATCDLALSEGVYATPEQKHRYQPSEKDYNLAAATIEHCEDYFVGKDVSELSDYENSLRVAMASGIAHPKFVGIVASAIKYYQREVEKRERQASYADIARDSRFQGQVKERRVFEGLKVLAYRTWQTDFGAKHFYAMVDGSNNSYVYFATRDIGLCVGQVVSLQGTVKKHEMYTPKRDGALSYQQTVLTRCQVVTRVRVASEEVFERPGAMMAKKAEPQQSLYVEYERPMEKAYRYHFVGDDGRQYKLETKSRKRRLVVGSVAIVSYDPDSAPDLEVYVGLVAEQVL
jgi:hypothetical protein